jgi:hypothetical protein
MVVAVFEVGDERGQQGLALPDPVIDPLFGAPFLHRDAAQGIVRDRARRHPRRPPFRFVDRPAVQVEVERPHRPQDLLGLAPLALAVLAGAECFAPLLVKACVDAEVRMPGGQGLDLGPEQAGQRPGMLVQ